MLTECVATRQEGSRKMVAACGSKRPFSLLLILSTDYEGGPGTTGQAEAEVVENLGLLSQLHCIEVGFEMTRCC